MMIFRRNFCIYQLPEGLGMRKILAHGIRMQKIHKPRWIFSGFSQIFIELCGSKVQLAPSQKKFINGVATSTSAIDSNKRLFDVNINKISALTLKIIFGVLLGCEKRLGHIPLQDYLI